MVSTNTAGARCRAVGGVGGSGCVATSHQALSGTGRSRARRQSDPVLAFVSAGHGTRGGCRHRFIADGLRIIVSLPFFLGHYAGARSGDAGDAAASLWAGMERCHRFQYRDPGGLAGVSAPFRAFECGRWHPLRGNIHFAADELRGAGQLCAGGRVFTTDQGPGERFILCGSHHVHGGLRRHRAEK